MNLNIDTPEWAEPLFAPTAPDGHAVRYVGVWGGRGGGKSHERAEALIEALVMNPNLAAVCLREVQKSIKLSVKRLLEIKITEMGVQSHFLIQDNQIKATKGSGIIIFQGMQNHTAESIKSLEAFDIAWFEEAQSASQRSLDLLRPTIRKPGSQLWFTWNPKHKTDPIDNLLRGDVIPRGSIVIRVNYSDNPWFPDVLRDEMEFDRSRDTDKYAHIWLGDYIKNSEARVFKNWTVDEFETPLDAHHRLGGDWGFSVDPTTLIRCHLVGRKLYIDYEAYKVGCEILDTPDLFMTVPESEKWPLIADSSRPETISHMRKNGFPKIMPSIKGAGSLEEGVEWLKSYDIIVHPRCVHTIEELTLYSYKVDPLTDEILPILEDKKNHVIDGLRYACENVRRQSKIRKPVEVDVIPVQSHW